MRLKRYEVTVDERYSNTSSLAVIFLSRNISNAELKRKFDVSILDEAHETAGAGRQMSLPLHDEHVPTRRRGERGTHG